MKSLRTMMDTLEPRMLMTVTAPSGLTATPTQNSDGVVLNWVDNAGDNDGYIVLRSDDGGTTYNQIAQINDPNIKTYADFATQQIDGDSNLYYEYLDPANASNYRYEIVAFSNVGPTNSAPSSAAAPASLNGFALYNNLLFTNRPTDDTFESQGLRKVKIIGGADILKITDPALLLAAEKKVADDTISENATILVLDIESDSFPFNIHGPGGSTAVQNTINLLKPVLAAIHAEWLSKSRSDLRVGVYSEMPLREYYRSDPGNPDYEDWQDANDALVSLVQDQSHPDQTVDILCPSLYTFFADQVDWERYARQNIDDAERAYEPDGGVTHPNWWVDKPILPYLWMNYHNKSIPMSADYWQRELSMLREKGGHVEGAVLWGGWQENWDDTAPWWQATQAFAANTNPMFTGYDLVAEPTATSQVTLSWRPAAGATSYILQTSLDGSTWTTLTGYTLSLNGAGNQYTTIVSATTGVVNFYQIAATDGIYTSDWSKVIATLGGTSGNDNIALIHLFGNNNTVRIKLNSSPWQDFDLSLFHQLRIDTFDGDDTLDVFYSFGDPTTSGGIIFHGGNGNDSTYVGESPYADTLTADEVEGGAGFMALRLTAYAGIGHPILYDHDSGDQASYHGGSGDSITLRGGTLSASGSGIGTVEVDGGTLNIDSATSVTTLNIGTRRDDDHDGVWEYNGNGLLNLNADVTATYINVNSGALRINDTDALDEIASQSILVYRYGTVGGNGTTVTANDVLAKIYPDADGTFDYGAGYLGIVGTSSETIDFSSYPTLGLAAIGNATFSGTLTLYGTTYRLGSAAGTLTFTPSLIYTDDVDITGNVTLTGSQVMQTLHIYNGTLLLAAGGNKVIRMSSLSITGGRLDLADNDLILDYSGPGSSPAVTIQSYLRSGYDGGKWDGSGIISSIAANTTLDPYRTTAIGWIENSMLGLSTFDGQSVDSSTLILKYTYYGDADMDGSVTAGDYSLADYGQLLNKTTWAYGDFNYDAQIDAADFALIDNAFDNQVGAL